MALSREQLHRVVDDLPADKLSALADLINTLIDEDDEPVGAEELAEYRRIFVRCGAARPFRRRVSRAVMFTLRFGCQAHKFLDKQSPDVRNRIRTALLELAKDPLANGQAFGGYRRAPAIACR